MLSVIYLAALPCNPSHIWDQEVLAFAGLSIASHKNAHQGRQQTLSIALIVLMCKQA